MDTVVAVPPPFRGSRPRGQGYPAVVAEGSADGFAAMLEGLAEAGVELPQQLAPV